jgi:hypothetical protein
LGLIEVPKYTILAYENFRNTLNCEEIFPDYNYHDFLKCTLGKDLGNNIIKTILTLVVCLGLKDLITLKGSLILTLIFSLTAIFGFFDFVIYYFYRRSQKNKRKCFDLALNIYQYTSDENSSNVIYLLGIEKDGVKHLEWSLDIRPGWKVFLTRTMTYNKSLKFKIENYQTGYTYWMYLLTDKTITDGAVISDFGTSAKWSDLCFFSTDFKFINKYDINSEQELSLYIDCARTEFFNFSNEKQVSAHKNNAFRSCESYILKMFHCKTKGRICSRFSKLHINFFNKLLEIKNRLKENKIKKTSAYNCNISRKVLYEGLNVQQSYYLKRKLKFNNFGHNNNFSSMALDGGEYKKYFVTETTKKVLQSAYQKKKNYMLSNSCETMMITKLNCERQIDKYVSNIINTENDFKKCAQLVTKAVKFLPFSNGILKDISKKSLLMKTAFPNINAEKEIDFDDLNDYEKLSFIKCDFYIAMNNSSKMQSNLNICLKNMVEKGLIKRNKYRFPASWVMQISKNFTSHAS